MKELMKDIQKQRYLLNPIAIFGLLKILIVDRLKSIMGEVREIWRALGVGTNLHCYQVLSHFHLFLMPSCL